MAEWARVVATTIADELRGFEDLTMRERVLLRRMKSAGNVKYNCSGDTFKWRVRKAQRSATVNNGAQPITYQPVNLWDTAQLDYEGYVITDAMTKREKLKNRGTPAIIKVWSEMTKTMLGDLEDKFSEELYIDSSAAGNSARITGLESMFAATQTITQTTTTSTVARTANAADMFAYPNDTYAGISTVLGNEGGSWAYNWPEGKGDAEFDYFSPVIVNYTSTGFDGTGDAWGENCVLATRAMLLYTNRNKASEGVVDLVLMDTKMFRLFKDKKDTTERVVVNQGSKDREYGIESDSFFQDGAEITHEFGVPAAVAYGINIKKTEICSMQDKLFVSDGPEWDSPSRSWRVAVDFLGQLKFHSPRHFGKLVTLA
jgi:hypothetical protein